MANNYIISKKSIAKKLNSGIDPGTGDIPMG
jgi:hypothetical protein